MILFRPLNYLSNKSFRIRSADQMQAIPCHSRAISQAIFEGSEGGEGQCGAQIAFSVPDRLVYFGTILLGRSLCSARLDLSATHAFVHLHCLKVYATHDLNSQTQLADRHPICSLTTPVDFAQLGLPTSSIPASSAMTDAL